MKEEGFRFQFKGEELWLLPAKAIWFPKYRTLLVSDTHLGKGAHFRKAGIAIPTAIAQEELACLTDLIDTYQPKELIFLGDLFHSDMNNDFAWFRLWREMHSNIKMILIKGNHDILPPFFYDQIKVEVLGFFKIGVFELYHDLPKKKTEQYILMGHIHPGVKIKGKARQDITLPCFYFGEKHGVLPAFGKFTGKALIKLKNQEIGFAIAGNKIIPLKNIAHPKL
ncbi:ligase-associated DNA damage response endonuclease PdeM [Pedobacter sp. SD-b]|uniref:Ligase-associated DNA damage response endonuclease PdeM n=1 Tax=Pedobacter segetis TaxID=2793069 RepID=A0ABS1BHE3_9SPHI|nr:ligase-associated DNA damage response endonuclease PdeM [Pedobacter segetis]MBK0382242.1 ligase-associated DNA damage response endonuclease PdeM [Pedobacter segetis]